MKNRLIQSLLVSLLIVSSSLAATVTIDPSTQHQTIIGWGNAGDFSLETNRTNGKSWVSPAMRAQLIDEVVYNFGITATMTSPGGYHPWEGQNDNGDPLVSNSTIYNTSGADLDAKYSLDVKSRVELLGDQYTLLVRSGYRQATPWLINSPGEYTENALSFMNYIKSRYGLDVDYWSIENEPWGHNKFIDPQVLAETMRTFGPALQGGGYPTKIMFPEGLHPQDTWMYVSALQNDPDIWQYVGLITWHLYGATDPYRSQIYAFAKSKGISTGQGETGVKGPVDLYYDLTAGGVSFWAPQFATFGVGSGSTDTPITVDESLTSFYRGTQFYNLRQILHYVRPGAVRLESNSTLSSIKTLAFKRNNQVTAVLISNATTPTNIDLVGLPSGTYGVSSNLGVGPYQELGKRTISGTFSISLPAGGVITIYPHSGVNTAPTLTDWIPTPTYLVLPSSTATLSSSATDAELDTISYRWTIKQKPTAANPTFANQNAASTAVNGLNVAGNYIFTITASDGAKSSSRDVFLNVYPSIPGPYLFNFTPYRSGDNEVGFPMLLDSDGKDFGGNPISYNWSIVSKPAGSNVTIVGPTANRVKTTNADRPGVYTFKLDISSAYGSYSDTFSMTVLPSTISPPVISTATGSQAGAGRAQLQATASDPDSPFLTYWWSMVSGPAGVKPTFVTRGSSSTVVTGLTAGAYVFQVAAIDNSNTATQTVNVTITGGGSSDTTPPSQVTGLSSANVTTSSITLSWAAATDNVGVTGYRIFRDGSAIGTTANLSFVSSGLMGGTLYRYTVQAYDAAGNNGAQSAAIQVKTVDNVPPNPPTSFH